jgi:hypothetical protein
MEASQRVIDPVLTSIVMVEDAHPLGRGQRDLSRCEARHGVSGSMIDRGPRGGHAQGVGVVSHMDGDVLHLHLVPIVHDLEGDIAWGYVEPEFLRYARTLLRVSGALCNRRACSSSSVRCLSSPSASLGRAYLHRCLFSLFVIHPSFVLNRSSFFIAAAVLEWGLTSTTHSISSFHVMGVAKEDRECVASAVVHCDPTSQTDDFMSEAGSKGSHELTCLPGPSSATFGAVAVLPALGTTVAVRVDCLCLSIRWSAVRSCSFFHSFISCVHTDLMDFCCIAQLDVSSMGTVWRQSAGFWCGEQGSGLANVVKGRHEDCVFREGAMSGGVDVVIVAMTVVRSRSAAVTRSEGDGYVQKVGVQLSRGGHGVVG